MAPYSIEDLRAIIAPIAQAHGVESVSLFGSYSKGKAQPGSDVDLKIEKGRIHGLYQLSGFRLAIEDGLWLHKKPPEIELDDAADNSISGGPQRRSAVNFSLIISLST